MDDLRQHGLAGLLLRLWSDRRVARAGRTQQMELLETLPLGGRRQLMLVRCAGERFLVGGGVDSVETIVKIGEDSEFAARESLCG